MNPTTLHAMREELIKIAYMTAAGPMYTGNMPKSMGTGMVSARQAQQMTQMPGVRSMRRGGIVPAGKNQVAVLHGPEAVAPLKGGKPTKRGQQVLDKITEKKAAVATKTDPAKWEQAKRDAKAKMGGKHSARAMQLATQLYKKRGGGYSGSKPTSKNNSLKKWGKQKWRWSGEKKASAGKGVYLPSAKIDRLKSTPEGRKRLAAAARKKTEATSKGKQYSSHGLAAGTSLKEKSAEVEYRGRTFPGYNKPIRSDRKGKKKMVLVKRGDKIKLVHFGQKGYEDFTQHKDKKRQKNYLTRSAGIRNKSGKLTKDDPFSPNYWARRKLW